MQRLEIVLEGWGTGCFPSLSSFLQHKTATAVLPGASESSSLPCLSPQHITAPEVLNDGLVESMHARF